MSTDIHACNLGNGKGLGQKAFVLRSTLHPHTANPLSDAQSDNGHTRKELSHEFCGAHTLYQNGDMIVLLSRRTSFMY